MENKKILIIDDEAFFIEPLRMYFEGQGMSVITAGDGLSGLNQAKSESPDAIILDLMLPVINGFQVCRLLKYDKLYSDIPIIIVSAKDTENDKALGEQSGANLYLTKPVNPANVYEHLIRYL